MGLWEVQKWPVPAELYAGEQIRFYNGADPDYSFEAYL
jgi:hypothetical protein